MSRANFVQVKLAAGVAAAANTLSVQAMGAAFNLPPADGGLLTITDSLGGPEAHEIIRYTARSGSGPYTLSGVTRGLEGTTARAWSTGAYLVQCLTAGEFDAKQDLIEPGQPSQFYAGDKTWRDLGNTVRALALTGIVFATSTAITAADTLLGALGKLQRQISDLGTSKLDTSAFVFANLGGKPTTLAGYGITDAAAAAHTHDYWPPDTAINGWYRSNGAVGWYSQTYGGGIYMTDATYVRTYGGKGFYCDGNEIVVAGAAPTLRLSDTNWGNRSLHCNDGYIGFLTTGNAWAVRAGNDRSIEAGGAIRFGEFARGVIYHEIDGSGNRFVRVNNWDGGGVHVIHAPGTFVGFGPNGDNNHMCGWGYARWSSVWAVTGAIQTSDAREKTPVRPLSGSELAAAKQIASEIGVYQWLEAVEKKGTGAARLHPGQTVQRIIAIMELHGLDPFAYGFVCFDEWAAVPPVFEEDGVTIKVAGREAGNRYSMRYDELNVFMARGLAQRQDELDARIAALEART